jgi:hypothetical protein
MRRILSGLAAAFVLLMLMAPASAEDDPAARGAALLAGAKAASGGPAWDALAGWHESGTAFLGGVQGPTTPGSICIATAWRTATP